MSPPPSPLPAPQWVKTSMTPPPSSLLKNNSQLLPKPPPPTSLASLYQTKNPHPFASPPPSRRTTKNFPQYHLRPLKSSCTRIWISTRQSTPSPMASLPPSTAEPSPPAKSSMPAAPESNSSTTSSLLVASKSPTSKDDWEPSTSPQGSNQTWATWPTPSPSAPASELFPSSSGG